MSPLNSMPFFQASPAASGGGVLRNENRMVFHWRLLSVLRRISRSNPILDKFGGVFHNGVHLFLPKIVPFRPLEFESSPEWRLIQPLQNVVDLLGSFIFGDLRKISHTLISI